MIIWLTGQPGSGKTTMATKVFKMYSDWLQLDNVIHLDGDDVRDVLDNKDYSLEGRRKNIQFAIDMARVLHEKDYIVICSFVSPYRDMREKLKEMSEVKEFYLHSTRKLRREYWVKDYEPPLENFTAINTDKSEEETLDEILNVCREVATLS
tara:strand:- start:11 stop:466 length:456 start_codon:yes stop_codon:yes gene_type:complete